MKYKLFLKEEVTPSMREAIMHIFNENETIKSTDAFSYCDEVILLYEQDVIKGYCLYQKNKYPPLKGIYINQIALAKDIQGQKKAKKFYHLLEENYNCDIYAHVSPQNKPSLKFHCQQGFIPIDYEITEDFYGHKNYLSFLFVKEYKRGK